MRCWCEDYRRARGIRLLDATKICYATLWKPILLAQAWQYHRRHDGITTAARLADRVEY